jgi:hypothetical protein
LRRSVVLAVLAGSFVSAAPAVAAPPPNDNFAAAQVISGTSASVSGTTVEATLEAGEPNHFAGNGSVWYSWTPPEDMVVQLTSCYPFSSSSAFKTQLWSGSTVSSLVEIERRADERECPPGSLGDVFQYNVTGGTTYAISVIEYGGDITFTLGLEATPSPANDNFADAQDLGQQLDVDVDGTNVGATLEAGEEWNGAEDGDSVWYRWTAPKRTRVWIDNCEGPSDTRVIVYTGSTLGSLTEVEGYTAQPRPPECEDFNRRRIEFLAKAGTTYMIRVSTRYVQNGAFHLRLRDVWFDGTLTHKASARKIRKGQKVTYTIDVENVGTVEIDTDVGMVTSKPNHLTKPVKDTKYVSVDATKGKCKPVMMLANPHPGATCDITLAPGESTRIVAKVKPSQSLSHWVALGIADDDPDNDFQEDPVNTVVKPKRRHRR